MIISNYEDLPFIDRRESFLRKLLTQSDYKIERIPLSNPFAIYCSRVMVGCKPRYTSNSHPEFKVYNLKVGTGLPEGEFYTGLNFNKEWNTRDILLSEGIIEIEKGDWRTNIAAYYETIKKLIRLKIEFYVFYAEGMRAPHIHIYGLFPNVQDWAEKELAMALFCQKIVPFEYFHLLDTALFGQQTIALEFSKHWKTGNMNKLIFWYDSQEEVCS